MKDEKTLFVCWQHPEGGGIYPVGRLLLRESSPRYEFRYIEGVRKAREQGFAPFFAFPELETVYVGDHLFPFFADRHMPRSREDYVEHVERLGLGPEAEPLALLARSGGRSVTDKVELFRPPEYDPASDTYVYHFFARGVRHIPGAEGRIKLLKKGDLLEIHPEQGNRYDPQATMLLDAAHGKVGYVPQYLTEDLGDLLKRARVAVEIERVNHIPAPVHHRLLCRMSASGATGFHPFATERYRPLNVATPGGAFTSAGLRPA